MNYALSWFGLVGISLAISLVAFVWALKTGQFTEQQRLRYLPLRGEEIPPKNHRQVRRPVEVKFLIAIGLAVCGIYLTAIIVALCNHG